MVLESTVVCVDNSDFMRNGDFVPTRLQAQQDAINLVCRAKTRSNPENNVALLTLAKTEVLVTLTTDVSKLLAKLHQVQPGGEVKFLSTIRIAHLCLKHRQGRNHRMRIVVFVGSPILDEDADLVKLAKKLKKEKVNVDIVSFGEEAANAAKLESFITTINGKEGGSSHLVTIATGPMLSDVIVTSPIIVGEDGMGHVPTSGFEFGIDPNEDPELALALRVSMEEQRARQDEEARRATAASTTGEQAVSATPAAESVDDALLKQALEMSMQTDASSAAPQSQPSRAMVDFDSMTEEQQIAYALQMSMQAGASDDAASSSRDVEMRPADLEASASASADDLDYSEVMNDPDFLQGVLGQLPGVDPNSEAIRNAVQQLTQQQAEKKDGKKKDSGKKDDKK